MDAGELRERVRTLRAGGRSPKEIARALGLPPATVSTLIRTIAAEAQADVPEGEVVGCWVSPGWSDGLTVEGHPEWPDLAGPYSGPSGMVSVLVERQGSRSRISACGYLVDVYCLGVKDVIGPRVMGTRAMLEFRRAFFSAYLAEPLTVPVELAQHLVFGAVEYARGLGFAPARDFDSTAAHLGTWTGPSGIGFGHHGKPFFVQGPYDNAARVLRCLERSVGRDNFHFLVSA